MLPENLKLKLQDMIAGAESPREKAIDVMFEIQEIDGWMSDDAMAEAAQLLGMSTLELEALATFYDQIYRSPVGKYVIQVCDSAICWMEGHQRVIDYVSEKAKAPMGGTSALTTWVAANCAAVPASAYQSGTSVVGFGGGQLYDCAKA